MLTLCILPAKAITPQEKAFLEVVKNNDEYRVELLIFEGVNLNAPSEKGMTSLNCVAWNNNLKMSEIIIRNGEDVNAEDTHGKTASYWANKNNSVEVMKLLISKGSDVNSVCTGNNSFESCTVLAKLDYSGSFYKEINDFLIFHSAHL